MFNARSILVSFCSPWVFYPLTADALQYIRHGELHHPTDGVYIYGSDLPSNFFVCSSSVAHSTNSGVLQPFGNYSQHIWVQVQYKAATVFPKKQEQTSKFKPEVAGVFATLIACAVRLTLSRTGFF